MATTGSGNVPTIVIVGAGAAGIFTAYRINRQFPGKFDIRLFEAAPKIGGNVSSVYVSYGGQPYAIDAGAQFFYPKAQPNYVNLVQTLGLSGETPMYPAGITIWESSTNSRLFWIPSTVSGFSRYSLEDWLRITEFGTFLIAAMLLNSKTPADWALTVDDWLAGVPLSSDFKQNVIKNFLYQFVSLPYASIGQASALYAVTYFVRTVVGASAAAVAAQSIGGLPLFQTSQSLIGLLGILEAALTASGVSAQTSSAVTSVAPGPGGVAVTVNGETINAQHVVMACDPGASATLLASGGTASADLITLLKGLGSQYLDLTVVMQQNGQCWMPGQQDYWEAVSTLVDTPKQSVAFNAWFGPLRPPYSGTQLIPVFKSWGAPNLDPKSCAAQFFSHTHDVLLPTTSFVQGRDSLVQYQGQNGLFFAGGWTNWFDSQEAALMSAMNIAQWLQGGTAPVANQVRRVPGASETSANVKSWLEMVRRHAPAPHQSSLGDLIERLP
ncbi:MAG TPA: FAD-dependent oxidoreductase [Candidatus Acidoferrum sp.]|nr:FAD-dependent oxidoreductase [Candidatus Acidoferrum sp.]